TTPPVTVRSRRDTVGAVRSSATSRVATSTASAACSTTPCRHTHSSHRTSAESLTVFGRAVAALPTPPMPTTAARKFPLRTLGFAAAGVLLLAALLFVGVSRSRSHGVPENAVAVVGDAPVSRLELDKAWRQTRLGYAIIHRPWPSGAARRRLRERVLRLL